MTTFPAFAHVLPYWTIRDVAVASGNVSVLVLVDGSLVVGFKSSGADVFSADNARLNRNATSLRRALNVLPPDAFLQAEWHTGLSYADVIEQFAARSKRVGGADDARRVLAEQRRLRARALSDDDTLARGRLVYFVGQRRALGLLGGHRDGAVSRMFSRRASPQSIGPAAFKIAVERLSEMASRVREELAAMGAALRPLDGAALLAELHRCINPTSCATTRLAIVDRPEDLPDPITRAPPYLIHRPLSLREQLPLGDLAWNEASFTLDDPPTLHRALSLERLPAFTRPDFMMGIQFRTPSRFRLISTFLATDREKLTEKLIRKRNIAHAQAGGVVRDVAANVAFSEYERVLETMLTNDQRVFAASTYVIVDGADHAALDKATRELKDAFSDVGVGSSRVDLQACKLEYSIVSPK